MENIEEIKSFLDRLKKTEGQTTTAQANKLILMVIDGIQVNIYREEKSKNHRQRCACKDAARVVAFDFPEDGSRELLIDMLDDAIDGAFTDIRTVRYMLSE
jgi:hypothetical protein